jgi:crotonobetainyl-CoA:carnitine CoA-transferase CaiB-like acyl-CoA transferase
VSSEGPAQAPGPRSARGVLDGVRVVDFTQVLAGPYGTSLLGDFGADVIKVEPPGGEPFRAIDNLIAPGESGYYYGINRSKRAMTLNLKDPAARSIVERLVRGSDVVVVGFRPAAVARIGLDFESLSSINPRLVYCSLTAFGDTGPLAAEPGMDIVVQALSGVLALTGEPDQPPVKTGPSIADFTGAFLMVTAVLAGLRVRDRDGIGQQVSVNLLDGQIAMLANFITPYFLTREPIRRAGGGHPQVVPYQVFEASDGFMVVACLNDTFWAPLCRGIDHAELIEDPRFATNPVRAANRGELIPFLERLFATATRDVWLARLRSHGVPCAPVNELEEALSQPQVIHNKALTELKHPVYGPYTVPSNPIKMSESPPRPHGYVPGVGEHTSEVLAELGFDRAQISAFQASGAV